MQYIYGENLVDSGRGEHCAACRQASWSSSCLPACLPAARCLQLVSHQPPASLICAASFKGTDHIRFPSRVVRRGIDWIELERPLPYDVRVAWNVRQEWGLEMRAAFGGAVTPLQRAAPAGGRCVLWPVASLCTIFSHTCPRPSIPRQPSATPCSPGYTGSSRLCSTAALKA